MLWHFSRGIIPTGERLQAVANIVDISCPLCSADAESDLHIMANYNVSRFGFKTLGVHLHQLSFTNLMDFLASVVHENTKLGTTFTRQEKHKITAATALILKRV